MSAKPGAGVEQMVKALKMPSPTLKDRVAALIVAKKLKKTGKTRGTKYFTS